MKGGINGQERPFMDVGGNLGDGIEERGRKISWEPWARSQFTGIVEHTLNECSIKSFAS